MLTSFPRWGMMGELESIGDSRSTTDAGIVEALDSFRLGNFSILSCSNPLAEDILAREDNDGTLRLDVYRGVIDIFFVFGH